MKSAALFGGSFDPPHIGHIEIVNELKKLDFIDEIVVMPTYLNPFKEHFSASPQLRLSWLKTIFADEEKVSVCDYEIRQNEKVPTIQSVKELLKRFQKVYVVIGADNLLNLHKWHNYDQLSRLVEFIVVPREDYRVDTRYQTIEINVPISSSELRKNIDKKWLPKKVTDAIIQHYQGVQ